MKRIIALLMCLTLMLLALVSCGGDDVLTPEAERPNLTLRMAIVVDDKTDAAGIAAMQKAFNDQCEVLLTTRIEFECIKASEYKARMIELMNEVEAARAAGDSALEDEKAQAGTATGGTVVEEDSNTYPAASKSQFDILLIADEEMYEQFVEEGWLLRLDTHFSETFKPLNTKIITSAKEASLINGGYYGVPANTSYGSYQYLMVNKVAADHYNIDPDNIHSLADAYGLIMSMQIAQEGHGLSKWQTMYGEDFAVIRNTADTFIEPNIKYLSQDGSATLLGATYGYNATVNAIGKARNLLTDATYTRYLEMRFVAEKNGYYGDGTEENFLLSVVEGDYGLRYTNEDYYFCPISVPVLEKEEIFGGMLAVSSFTVNEKRSLEIVQDLMTNATRGDLLNIVLYGDAQTNYSIEDGCVVYRAMSNYGVHPDYLFGNLRELAYPCADFGQNKDFYVNAVNQINEMGKRTPLFDETYSRYFAKIDTEKWTYVDALGQEKLDALLASETLEEFRVNITTLAEELNADETYTELLDSGVGLDTMTKATLGAAFFRYTYNKTNGIVLPEE